jgi:hypothetical protein
MTDLLLEIVRRIPTPPAIPPGAVARGVETMVGREMIAAAWGMCFSAGLGSGFMLGLITGLVLLVVVLVVVVARKA